MVGFALAFGCHPITETSTHLLANKLSPNRGKDPGAGPHRAAGALLPGSALRHHGTLGGLALAHISTVAPRYALPRPAAAAGRTIRWVLDSFLIGTPSSTSLSHNTHLDRGIPHTPKVPAEVRCPLTHIVQQLWAQQPLARGQSREQGLREGGQRRGWKEEPDLAFLAEIPVRMLYISSSHPHPHLKPHLEFCQQCLQYQAADPPLQVFQSCLHWSQGP